MVSVSAVEGSPIAFKPTLLYPYSQDLALCYATEDGTATAAAGDYTPIASQCFTIPAWSATGPTISVSTLIDQVPEATSETFKFKVWGWAVPVTGNVKTVSGVIKANAT